MTRSHWSKPSTGTRKVQDLLHNLDQALRVSTEAVGSDPPTTINCQSTLALLNWEQGNFNDATMALRKILRRGQKSLGEARGKAISTMSDLAACLFKLGSSSEPKAQINRAVKVAKAHLEAHDLDRFAILRNAAGIYRRRDQPDLELSYESFDLSRRVKRDDNSETLSAMIEYAQALICNDSAWSDPGDHKALHPPHGKKVPSESSLDNQQGWRTGQSTRGTRRAKVGSRTLASP
jgi:tetratricopeptide (TPR) repeat protein